jgi:hypothetical protein
MPLAVQPEYRQELAEPSAVFEKKVEKQVKKQRQQQPTQIPPQSPAVRSISPLEWSMLESRAIQVMNRDARNVSERAAKHASMVLQLRTE